MKWGVRFLLRASLRTAAKLPSYLSTGDPVGDSLANMAIALRRWPETLVFDLTFGRLPSYVNPVLYAEKIQWRKLFDRNPDIITFCDKLASKEYARSHSPGLRIPEVLWSGTDARLIPFRDLDPPYVIKANNRSRAVIFVWTAEDLDEAAVVATCTSWMESRPHRHRVYEWGYGSVASRILVERALPGTEPGKVPPDIKVLVFSGKAHYLYWRDAETGSAVAVDREWQLYDWD